MDFVIITDIKNQVHIYNKNRVTLIDVRPVKGKDNRFDATIVYSLTENHSTVVRDKIRIDSVDDSIRYV